MEKIRINNKASEKRITDIINTVYNIANNYAKDGYDVFKVRVNGTLGEFWQASLTLREYNIHIKGEDYTHNGEYGDKGFVIATFEIK